MTLVALSGDSGVAAHEVYSLEIERKTILLHSDKGVSHEEIRNVRPFDHRHLFLGTGRPGSAACRCGA
jgi:hypothetical protein